MMYELSEEQIAALIQFDFAAVLKKIRKPGNTITKYDLIKQAIDVLKICSQESNAWARSPGGGFTALKCIHNSYVLIYEWEQYDNNL